MLAKLQLLVFAWFILLIQSAIVSAQPGEVIHGDGFKIHYQTFGSGEPILIINGGPGMNSEGFTTLAKKLSINHRTIIYDQRGTGLSSVDKVDSTTITMDLMVDDIEVLREYLGVEKWTIMGHSFGGMLAYYYATKYPDRIHKMIQSSSGGMDLALLDSINITGSLTQMQRDSLSFYTARINNGDHSYQTRLKRGKFLAPAYLYDQKHVEVVAERLTQGNSRINSLVWQNLQQINYNTKEKLESFKKPVLIIHGMQDVVGISIAETAHQVLPNSRLLLLDRCRHYGWLDRRETYFSEIERFLASDDTFQNEREIL